MSINLILFSKSIRQITLDCRSINKSFANDSMAVKFIGKLFLAIRKKYSERADAQKSF